MEMLVASLLALAVGPLLVSRVKDIRSATVAIDAFVIVAIGGLILVHILPGALTKGGWGALLALVIGLFGPLLAERGLRPGVSSTAGRLVIFLALAGLAAHAVIDGLALGHDHAGHDSHAGHSHGPGEPHDHGAESKGLMSLAVVLHRLPVGIGIWWLIPRTLGPGIAVLTLLLIGGATVFGFAVEGVAMDGLRSGRALAIFEGLLAGSLLHVVFHSHLPRARKERGWEPASALGTIAALGILVGVTTTHPSADVSQAADTFMRFALQSAPALLLAYFIVGFVHVLLPGEHLRRVGGRPFGQAVRGVVAGLPVPICSCGIVPLYRELILKGTPAAAAMAFLVATPELEIAAFLLSMELMGAPLAVARLVAAAVLALFVGWVVGRTVRRHANEPDAAATCCATPQAPRRSARDVVKSALRFGFGEAVDHTAAWILLGLGIAALASPYLNPDWLVGVHPFLQVTGAALIGLPLYVCASGSTPLAAMLIATGLSPGAGVALLLTGPATNVTTFGLLSSLHGRRTALAFGSCTILGAIALGLGVDLVLDSATVTAAAAAAAHAHEASLLEIACLCGLTAVIGASLLRQGTRPFIERVAVGSDDHDHDHDQGSACG